MKLPPELARKVSAVAIKQAIANLDKPDIESDAEDMGEVGEECTCPECGHKGPSSAFAASPTEGEPIAQEDD